MIVAIASIDGDTEYLEPIPQSALDGFAPKRHRAHREQSGTKGSLLSGAGS
jgi:hypothetical protein